MKVALHFNIFLVIILLFISPLSADLIHRYSFGADAGDSVGTANGTLMNGATVSGGQVSCDGSDDYVDLPGDVIAINSLTTGLTLELWSTQPTINQDFSMTASFGGEWSNGTGQDYLMISTTRGNNSSRAAIANTPDDASLWADEKGVDGPELNDALEHYYVLTVDDPAADGSGAFSYYIDGVLQGAVGLTGTLVSGLSNSVAYLGKGTYTNDGAAQCTINEYRIYNSVLTTQQIQDHYEWGPDALSEPQVQITESDGMTILYTGNIGQTDTYDVVLLSLPTDDVLLTVIPPTGLSVGNGSGTHRILTFTDQNWDQSQTVEVSIADAGVAFDEIEMIQHTIQSNDPQYTQFVRNVPVYIQEDECGVWGYLPGDYDLNCYVNLEDFSILAGLWLATDAPLDLDEIAGDWLLNTLTYDAGLVGRSIQESDQPFFVNTATVLNSIDEKVYGHFFEHIYHSANGGLWGDLVWNRSFEMTGSGGGIWTIEGSDLVQSSLATDVHMEFGDPAWTDYELTLQAQKDSGNEAFLILFRAVDSDNFYWFNIGGWGNTEHAIQKEVNGSRSTVS